MNTSEMSDSVKMGIAIIIVCILLGIVIGLVMYSRAEANKGISEVSESVSGMENSKLRLYDNTIVSGAEVIAFVQNNKNRDISTNVHTLKNPIGVNYGRVLVNTNMTDFYPSYTTPTPSATAWSVDSGTRVPGPAGKDTTVEGIRTAYVLKGHKETYIYNTNVVNIQNPKHKTYIRPTAKFRSFLIRDRGDLVVGVLFIQETVLSGMHTNTNL